MQAASTEFQSHLTMTLEREGRAAHSDFTFTSLTQKVPSALWGISFKPQIKDPSFIESAVVGYSLSSKTPEAKEKLPIDIEKLIYTSIPHASHYKWDPLDPLNLTSDDEEKRKEVIQETINAVEEQRLQMLKLFFPDSELLPIQFSPHVENQFLIVPHLLQRVTL